MEFPVDGLRRSYFDRKKSAVNFEDSDLLDDDMGYSPEEITAIKGGE
jgi:hypothetical protein